uniref:LRRCT domain-containing protein n=1 Tax=Parastrongyloides trichosuri TaxID=131310 RepID=A0A0N5A3W6_PARTI
MKFCKGIEIIVIFLHFIVLNKSLGAVEEYFNCGHECQCVTTNHSNSITLHAKCTWRKLELFPIASFPYKHNLTTLTISCTGHKETGPSIGKNEDLFLGFYNLNFLAITNCWLGNLPKNYFSHLSTVISLKLENNHIEYIDNELFKPLNSIMWLTIAYNELNEVPVAVSHAKELSNLILNNNNINKISKALRNLTSLSALDLSNNQLPYIDTNKLPKSLTILNLRANNLTSFYHNKTELPRLKTLNLGINLIPSIGNIYSVNNFPSSVQRLYLDLNPIQRIDDNAFIEMVNLSILDLRETSLEIIPENKLTFRATKPVNVFLSLNPIKCHCINEWIAQKSNVNKLFVIKDIKNVKCVDLLSPENEYNIHEAFNNHDILCPYDQVCGDECTCCMSANKCSCSLSCLPGCNCYYNKESFLYGRGINKVVCSDMRTDKIKLLSETITELHLTDGRARDRAINNIPNMDNLKMLNVARGNILTLNNIDLRKFPKLEILNFKDNKIYELNNTNYDNLGSIKHLNLKGNNLIKINDAFLKYVEVRIDKIWLGGSNTEYMCSCKNKSNLQVWLEKPLNRKKVQDIEFIKCQMVEDNSIVNITQVLQPYNERSLCFDKNIFTATTSPIKVFKSDSITDNNREDVGNIKEEDNLKVKTEKMEKINYQSKYDVPLVTDSPIYPKLTKLRTQEFDYQEGRNERARQKTGFTFFLGAIIGILICLIFCLFVTAYVRLCKNLTRKGTVGETFGANNRVGRISRYKEESSYYEQIPMRPVDGNL